MLIDNGGKINIYDPLVNKNRIEKDLLDFNIDSSRCEIQNNGSEIFSHSDAIAILTEHKEFKNPELSKVIFDGRGINNSAYYTIGR